MIRTVKSESDWQGSTDPFVLAQPVWYGGTAERIESYLAQHGDPKPTVSHDELFRRDIRIIEENKRMAFKMVKELEAPARLHVRASSSLAKEYFDVVQNIKQLPAGQAMVVTLESEAFTKPDAKKPEVTFAYSLRRYFTSQNLGITAYQSGKLEVTVRRMTKDEIESHRRKAAKKKKTT